MNAGFSNMKNKTQRAIGFSEGECGVGKFLAYSIVEIDELIAVSGFAFSD